jgi:ArsR family transcriptional regulator, arsenate/arsenite/antimonite-responsive transcriptional repressor / arsenate reductase (thioredoxin)
MDVEESLEQRAAVHRALGEAHRLAIVDELRLSDRTPGELAEATALGMNLLAFHLGVLEEAGVVTRHRSAGDGRRRYVTLRHAVLERAGVQLRGDAELHADRVLFVCTHNAARSQLAAALWRGRTGRTAQSAGSAPARAVHPLVVAVAGSRGVDLSACAPQGLEGVDPEPDLVVTVCDRALEAGLPFADVPRLHWSIADPIAEGTPAAFARAYDEVAERIEHLAEQVAAA